MDSPQRNDPEQPTGLPGAGASPDAGAETAVPTPREPTEDGTVAGPAGSTDDAEPQPEAEPAPVSVWNARTILVLVLAVGIVVCSAGLLYGFHTYNKLAEPDRSSPEVTVEQYVAATFNNHDAGRAGQLVCSGSRLADIDAMQHDLASRSTQFSTQLRVDTANYAQRTDGDSTIVEVDLKVTTAVSRSSRRWAFELRQQDGWRICAAHRIG